MSKNNNLKKSNPAKTNVNSNTSDLWDMLDKFLEKKAKVLFIGSFILTVLFSMLLFEVRVSLTGDDSTYIIRASRFFHDGTFPTFQGPLYPIILAPFVAFVFFLQSFQKQYSGYIVVFHHVYFIYQRLRFVFCKSGLQRGVLYVGAIIIFLCVFPTFY